MELILQNIKVQFLLEATAFCGSVRQITLLGSFHDILPLS
jgi:hypothetical protein